VTSTPALSLVTPAFNEAENLPVLYSRLSAAAAVSVRVWESLSIIRSSSLPAWW
jgi:hypothetical protein